MALELPQSPPSAAGLRAVFGRHCGELLTVDGRRCTDLPTTLRTLMASGYPGTVALAPGPDAAAVVDWIGHHRDALLDVVTGCAAAADEDDTAPNPDPNPGADLGADAVLDTVAWLWLLASRELPAQWGSALLGGISMLLADPRRLGDRVIHYDLAAHWHSAGDITQARGLHQCALTAARRRADITGDRSLLPPLLWRWLRRCNQLGQPALALQCQAELHYELQRRPDWLQYVHCLIVGGELHLAQDKPSAAMPLLTEAVSLTARHDPVLHVEALILLARALLSTGKPQRAQELLRQVRHDLAASTESDTPSPPGRDTDVLAPPALTPATTTTAVPTGSTTPSGTSPAVPHPHPQLSRVDRLLTALTMWLEAQQPTGLLAPTSGIGSPQPPTPPTTAT